MPKPLRRAKHKSKQWRWHIREGDCLDVLKLQVVRPRLIFADPPYNFGKDYGEGIRDNLKPSKYLDWQDEWIEACFQVLSSDGSMWVLLPDEWVADADVSLSVRGLHRRSWVIWYETFGVNCKRKFNRCKRHLLYYVKDEKNFVFNRKAVTRPSDRQTKYGDKRASADGKVWDDVWQVPRLCGTHKERISGFPTQLPLALLRPIVGCCSNKGDLVLDPFSGSGTTGVACVELSRRYVGIEKSAEYCQKSRKRLEKVKPSGQRSK